MSAIGKLLERVAAAREIEPTYSTVDPATGRIRQNPNGTTYWQHWREQGFTAEDVADAARLGPAVEALEELAGRIRMTQSMYHRSFAAGRGHEPTPEMPITADAPGDVRDYEAAWAAYKEREVTCELGLCSEYNAWVRTLMAVIGG